MDDMPIYTIARTKSGTDHLSDEGGILCGAKVDHYGDQVFLREFNGCTKCRNIAGEHTDANGQMMKLTTTRSWIV